MNLIQAAYEAYELDQAFDALFPSEFSAEEVTGSFLSAGVEVLDADEKVFVTSAEQDQADSDWSSI